MAILKTIGYISDSIVAMCVDNNTDTIYYIEEGDTDIYELPLDDILVALSKSKYT